MDYEYDLLVIGAGSGGVRAARLAAASGAKVAVVEEKYLGGTCVNVGCVPKKLFYYGAHFSEDFHDARGFGWRIDGASHDWPTLRDNKNREIERLNGIYLRLLENNGVTVIDGRAKLASANSVVVNGKEISAQRILIAAGGQPHVPEFVGSELVVTSDDIFYLDTLPARAAVVGGGYIAVEFAGILQGLGVDVELIYRGNQLLRHFDQSLGERLKAACQSKGIELRLETTIDSIASGSDGALILHCGNGESREVDLVLYATGRTPLTADLGLESLGVELRKNGTIVVDEYFQTAVPSVFAIGDIIGTPELTPVALAQGNAFVKTWFHSQPETVDYNNLPTAVFSQPNIATVGLTEQQARESDSAIDVYESEFRHLKHTLSGNQEKTFMKMIVDRPSGRVLGVHMLGADAGEIIQGIAVALNAGATKDVFDRTIGIHPTAAEEFVTMREPVTQA